MHVFKSSLDYNYLAGLHKRVRKCVWIVTCELTGSYNIIIEPSYSLNSSITLFCKSKLAHCS